MELKNVIHYYIGQMCYYTHVNGVEYKETITPDLLWRFFAQKDKIKEYKPVLRKSNSLTDKECIKLASFVASEHEFLHPFIEKNSYGDRIVYWGDYTHYDKDDDPMHYFNADAELVWNAEQFHYLLSIGIDLFGLIDNNHAIDKATL